MSQLYRHFDGEGRLLYVGISLNAMARLAQHKNCSHWFRLIKRVEIEPFPSREEAIKAEISAITKENPLHNLSRPKFEDLELAKSKAEKSRNDLLSRVVKFNPIYSLDEVAAALGVGKSTVKELLRSGKLAFVNKPNCNRGRLYVTGWQLIDYIEYLEKGEFNGRKKS